MKWESERINGWLTPTGRIYKLHGFAQHNEFAMKFLEEKWIKSGRMEEFWDLNDEIDKELDCWSGYAYEVLEKWGWVRILDWGTSSGVDFLFYKKPNKRQTKVIFDICTDNNIPLPDNIFK